MVPGQRLGRCRGAGANSSLGEGAVRGSPALGSGCGLRIIPRQPGLGDQLHRLGVNRKGQQIFEGIDPVDDPVEPAGVDETHEQIARPGSVEGLVAETVFAVQEGHLPAGRQVLRACSHRLLSQGAPAWRRNKVSGSQCLSR